MIPLTEFQRRAISGPVMREQEFDKAFSRKVREIVSRYEIKYDPENIIADDARADAVFQAGVDLLAEIGFYHIDTHRVIQFSKEEVLQIAKEAWDGPREETFGKGKDAVTVHYRTSEDPQPPVFFLGTTSTASTEELYIPWLQSFAQEELAQGMLSFGVLTSWRGLQNRAGTPGEVICSQAELKGALEVARRVGKPGMLLGRSSATSPGAILASYYPGGLERHNAVMSSVYSQPEHKLDWNRLVLAVCAEERGIVPYLFAINVMGALCRGPEDAAVTQVSVLLGQLGYAHGTIVGASAVGLDGSTSRRGTLWAHSAAARAAERHVGVPTGTTVSSLAGAGTEMAVYEKAAITLSAVCSGDGWIYGTGCGKRGGENTNTGLEGRIIGETAQAVAGMERDKANGLLQKILSLYEDQLDSAPEGKTFSELYDVKTVQPTAEYLAVYQRAKEELARLGVQ